MIQTGTSPSRLWWRVLVLVGLGTLVAIAVELWGSAWLLSRSWWHIHLLAGATIGGAAALLARRLSRYYTQHRVLAVVVVLQLALLWEGLEILLPGIEGLFVLGALDTAVDLLATTGGAVLAMLVVPGGGSNE